MDYVSWFDSRALIAFLPDFGIPLVGQQQAGPKHSPYGACCARRLQRASLRSYGIHRLPRRALAYAAELGRENLPEPHLLQRSRQGRHFAAGEQPELFAAEVRAAFRSLR